MTTATCPATSHAAVERCFNDLLNREQTAEYLGVAVNTLAVWKSTGRYDLPVVKVGRSVRYRKSDLDAWLESRTVRAAESD